MSRWDAIWAHLRWVYDHAGKAYTVVAAGWYEKNEPWCLAGMQEKVRRAIDKKEAERAPV
jgi:hypothetical protein